MDGDVIDGHRCQLYTSVYKLFIGSDEEGKQCSLLYMIGNKIVVGSRVLYTAGNKIQVESSDLYIESNLLYISSNGV